MVEKIIINPNKVRGYGNIMSPHSSSDYEVYMSSISSGTDTVNGQTMTVYELEDTILFWDKAVTGMKNTNYTKSNTGVTATVSSNGTTVTSSTNRDSFYIEDVLISGDFIAEFTVVAVNVYGGIAWLNSSKSHQWNIEYDLWSNAGLKYGNTVLTSDTTMNHKIAIKRVGSTVTFYKDDVQIGDSYTVTDADGYLGWKTHNDANRSITFKDFTIKSL